MRTSVLMTGNGNRHVCGLGMRLWAAAVCAAQLCARFVTECAQQRVGFRKTAVPLPKGTGRGGAGSRAKSGRLGMVRCAAAVD